MSPERDPDRPYHHGQLREALVAVGLELGAEGGPEAITVREAARRAGVAANAAYRHFTDLLDLKAEVALRARALLSASMQAELARAPRRRTAEARAREQLAATGRGYVRFALGAPNLFRCAWMECSRPDSLPSARGALFEALGACVEAGLLRPAETEVAAAGAWSLVHGYAELALKGLLGTTEPAALEAIGVLVVDRFAAGLPAR